MKTSDIPDNVILEYLAKHQDKWTMWFSTKNFKRSNDDAPSPSIADCLTEAGIVIPNDKLILSKMKSFIKRGLSGGCDCGCRGDYVITDKGLALIGKPRTHEYNGY